MSHILHESLRQRHAGLQQSESLSCWVDGLGPTASSSVDGTFHTPPLSSHLPTLSSTPPPPTSPPSPLSLPLTAVTLTATWGIKWYYEERLLAELNCITRTGNIPWECVGEQGEKRVEGRWVLVGSREGERERKGVLSELSTQTL